MTPHLPIEVKTSRLRLRRPVLSDAAAIFRSYAQDAEVCRYMIWLPHASEVVTQKFIAECASAWEEGNRLPYVITTRDSDEPIGMIEARLQGGTVDIGYVLARGQWGQGFMPEAIRALAAVALSKTSVFRVHAACDTENVASQRVLEKAGFLREGRLDRYTVHPNISPEPRACLMYAKCR